MNATNLFKENKGRVFSSWRVKYRHASLDGFLSEKKKKFKLNLHLFITSILLQKDKKLQLNRLRVAIYWIADNSAQLGDLGQIIGNPSA